MSNKAVSTLKGIIPNIFLIFAIGVVIIIFPTEPLEPTINVITAADLSLIPCDTLKPSPVNVISNVTSPMHNDKKNANNITTPLIGGDLTNPENITNGKFKNENSEKAPLINKSTPTKDKKTYTDDELLFHESLKNYVSVITPGTKDKECKPFDKFKTLKIFTYLLFSSFKVCCNMSDTVINLISKILHIQYYNFFLNILFFYIFIIGVTMAFSAFINLFIPINIKIEKNTAIIYDVLFSIFGVLAVLYVTCLLPTIVIFIIYLVKFMIASDMIPLIMFICVVMLLITLSVFLPLILDSVVKEGATNKKSKNKDSKKKRDTKKRRDGIKSKKNKDDAEDDTEDITNNKDADKASKNAWGYLSFISITIPIFACIYSIFSKFFTKHHNTSIIKLANVGGYGLIILVIVIFLEIYTPYVNTLLELF